LNIFRPIWCLKLSVMSLTSEKDNTIKPLEL
jgi:hypothetical protein